ncbi:MAG: ABC transporter permease subunit [Rhodocyclaceae bacterium]|jgi:phosphate transport system permease protein|nr:ABC transporter permease subunit [Rhodocyclaceae bacterium]
MEKIEANISKVGGLTGRRMTKDKIFKHVMTFGGLSVIVAISLIFFYLASVVVPVFMPPSLGKPATFRFAESGADTVYLTSEEQAEIGVRMTLHGEVRFFGMQDGHEIAIDKVTADGTPVSFAAGDPAKGVVAYGLADGRLVLVKPAFEVRYTKDPAHPGKDIRTITPHLEYPLGKAPIVIDPERRALKRIAVQYDDNETSVAALTADGRLLLTSIGSKTNLITGETSVEQNTVVLPPVPHGEITQLLLEVKQRELYVLHDGRFVTHYDVMDKANPRLVQTVELFPAGETVGAATMLSGGYSLIIGSDKGNIAQWFLVRDQDNNYHLTHIRSFPPLDGKITVLVPEYFRKGFLAGDERGELGLYYATSQRQLLTYSTGSQPVVQAGIAPRGNALLAESADGRLTTAHVHNEYPEVSFSALWQKVWYESYSEPEYVWQSTAANSDFEPKFSLAPLTLGTLKAAFYAMLVAVPLAVLGAIFAAYFMSPKMRGIVKPSIEIMQALPTVVLGFLAGLWLAPYIDNNLAGTLLAIFLLPVTFLLAAWLWHRLPQKLTQRVGPGWEAALLIPVILTVMAGALEIGHPLEAVLFDGDLPHWLHHRLGWSYEQRNSLVVGIAMGFAVIPTIFSIAEDAVFSVPKHLTSGSLALGATPWQTLYHVVLLTASPGIFSAILIGLGRAIGETMIVLMATGNTAVMDLSIFTGFRTLSANVGVEMGEAAVGTTHYRLLFFSALVLFLITFVANTLGELVRQRLREKYSSL